MLISAQKGSFMHRIIQNIAISGVFECRISYIMNRLFKKLVGPLILSRKDKFLTIFNITLPRTQVEATEMTILS
jgi:hypothetical protein